MTAVRPAGRGSAHLPGTDFARFYAGTVQVVFGRARALAGDRHVAWDATQEAFARMLKLWPERCARTIADNQAYTMVIARNLVTDWFRASGWIASSSHDEDLYVEDRALDAVLDEAGLLKTVRELLNHLPARRALVAKLYFLEGCTCGEIASDLGIAPSTVRTHVERVRAMLKPHVARLVEVQQGGDS